MEGCVTIPAYTDVNDRPMGVIKIIPENITEHERKRLVFESTLATEIKVEQKVGETWVYLTAHKTKSLRIKHPDFGVTEFDIPMEIEPNQCYEMVLSYLPPTTNTATEYAQLKKYHLIVKTDQPDATIYIDDEPLNTGVASKLVTEGTTHTYKIEYNLYHTETGFVTVNERTEIEKKLRPNFGYLNVTTSPEQGAKVYVDGNYIGVSPIKTDKLISGRHTVRVMKDKYKANIQYFEVVAGQTIDAKINMETNFVNVTINTDSDSDIYVDDEYKAKGKWTGTLSDGSHIIEARKANHKTTIQNVELVLGEDKVLTLEAPRPFSGSCEINSSPIEADIYVDGKRIGQTPYFINEIFQHFFSYCIV